MIITSRKGRPQGSVEIDVSDDDGSPVATLILHRPCYHSLVMEHLLNGLKECRDLETGPQEDRQVLEFRRDPELRERANRQAPW